MPKNIILSKSAKADIHEIIQFIQRDKPVAAEKFRILLEMKIQPLENFSERGKKIELLKDTERKNHRELVFPPCRIFYRVLDKEVHILRVLHSRQNFDLSS